MADYWQIRYLDALSKIEKAETAQLRAVYVDLAEHYIAMQRLCERSTPPVEWRLAA